MISGRGMSSVDARILAVTAPLQRPVVYEIVFSCQRNCDKAIVSVVPNTDGVGKNWRLFKISHYISEMGWDRDSVTSRMLSSKWHRKYTTSHDLVRLIELRYCAQPDTKIHHFRDVRPSQSLSTVLKKVKLIQLKQACTDKLNDDAITQKKLKNQSQMCGRLLLWLDLKSYSYRSHGVTWWEIFSN